MHVHMVLLRRLDSLEQAACLSCRPFTNLLSKIDKKMVGPPIFQRCYVFVHLELYFTKQPIGMYLISLHVTEVKELPKLHTFEKRQNARINFPNRELKQKAYLESTSSVKYVRNSPQGKLDDMYTAVHCTVKSLL